MNEGGREGKREGAWRREKRRGLSRWRWRTILCLSWIPAGISESLSKALLGQDEETEKAGTLLLLFDYELL